MTKKSIVALLCVALIIGSGCGLRKKSKYTNLQIGKIRLVGEDRPADAVEYLERSIDKEPATRVEAQVYLLIAYRRAMAEEVAAVTGIAERFKQPERQLLATLRQQAPEAANQLIFILSNRNRIQQDAAKVLTEIGAPAVPAIVEALRRFSKVQDICLNILEQIGSPAVEYLVEAAADESLKPYVRTLVIQALERIRDPKAIASLKKLREESSDSGIRMEATVALYKLGDLSYGQEILDGLGSDHILIRRISARTLVAFNSFPTQRVLEGLDDPDSEVRLWLVKALDTHPDPSARDPLINILLNDPDERVKNAARTALLNYGEPIAKRMVTELLKQEDWKVRVRIVMLLRDPKVIGGIDADGAYKLDEYYRTRETHKTVKEELIKLLKDPALPRA